MEYSDGGGRRRVDLISNTVLDILAGDDDGGEAVGAGWMHLRVRARTKLHRGFVVPRHLQRFGAARVHVPARRG